MGQDGGLGLRRDRIPERCGDRRSRSHTLYYETSVQKVRTWDGSGRPKTPSSMRRTAYQLHAKYLQELAWKVYQREIKNTKPAIGPGT